MTVYEMRISDWSSDVCSSDLNPLGLLRFNGLQALIEKQDGFKRRRQLEIQPGLHDGFAYLAQGEHQRGVTLAHDENARRQHCQNNDKANQSREKTLHSGLLSVKTDPATARSEEHTSELQSLMRISYAVFCLK